MVSRCLNLEYLMYEIDSNFKMNIFFKASRQDSTNAQILEFEKMCTNITSL